MTSKETFEERDNITINLTPFIYENKPVDDESFLIVLNRIVTFLVLFTGFSIKEFSNLVISLYFASIFSFYDYQPAKRIFYLIIFLLFLIHFLFLYNCLIHPMIESSYNHFVHQIELPDIRFCYKTEIYLDFYNYTFKKLEGETLNFSHILNEITIHGDDNKVATKLNFSNFTPKIIFNPIVGDLDGWVFGEKELPILYSFYFDDLKCFNFVIESNKTSTNIHTQFKKLQKLFSISFNLTKIDLEKKKVFLFLNKRSDRDFDWNMQLTSSAYNFKFAYIESYYQDDYWYIKNLLLWLKNLLEEAST